MYSRCSTSVLKQRWVSLVHVCDMTHSYVRHDSFMYVTWLMHMRDKGMEAKKKKEGQNKMFEPQSRLCGSNSPLSVFNSVEVWRIPFCRGIFWLNQMAWGLLSFVFIFDFFCTTTKSRFWIFWGREFIIFDERNLFLSQRYKSGTYGNRISTRFGSASIPSVRHDSLICATWLIHMCNMTHSHVRHDSFIWATWLMHMHDMTHANVRLHFIGGEVCSLCRHSLKSTLYLLYI